MIYFDNAASTPLEPRVVKLMESLMRENFGNPSSIHEYGRRARVLVEKSRKNIARLLGVSPSEIVFTSGGTEANNHIIWNCYMELKFDHFITSPLEHPSVLKTLDNISKYFNIHVKFIDIDNKGHVDLEHLDLLLKNSPPSVVSLMHANNELGNLLPVNQVKKICEKYGAFFHSDTIQTVGKFKLDMKKLGFDAAVASAHKFHGPKGAGLIYNTNGNKLNSFICGGSQERNLRAGTENVYGIAGMSLSLELAMNKLENKITHINNLKKLFITRIKQELPGIKFNGDYEDKSLYSIINISLPQNKIKNSDMLLANLDIEGISVSSGSACSSGSTISSHVMRSLGYDDNISNLRVSFSQYNNIDEIDRFVEVLNKLLKD